MFSVEGGDASLEYRVRVPGEGWRAWRPIEVTWREGDARVGRGLLQRPAVAVEFRTGATELRSLYAEFPSTRTARTERPLTRDLPRVGAQDETGDDVETRRQRAAPSSLVVSRRQWNARDPDKTCGVPHTPRRMTIHHTYRPADDGGDPARRMRQMQAFHIDNRGWCDIGYHFVVSQSGRIFQGRSTEKRTGAHVGGENDGNIGTALIGDYQNNPVIGRQLRAASEIVGWIHRTYGIPLNRRTVKGHREWPGQRTSCPGDNLLPRLPDILRWASQQPSRGDYDVEIDASLSGIDDRYRQGSSRGVSDALPNARFRADLLMTNRSDEPIRDVRLGYEIATHAPERPWLAPVDYTIYTDHPAHDRSSWRVNDADDAPDNPPDDRLRTTGQLELYAFSPGETKRIHLELRARRYSLGAAPPPRLRTWVRHIEDVYETKTGWDDAPSTDTIRTDLRDQIRVDIPSRSAWHFDSQTSRHDLEGWEACCGADYETLTLDREASALTVEVRDGEARLLSPPWTRVVADDYDQLLLRVRSETAPHHMAVYWRSGGEAFEETHGLAFQVPEGDGFQTIAVPLETHEAWTGEIAGLRIAPRYAPRETFDLEERIAIETLYFQSSARETTSSSRARYRDLEPVDVEPVDDTNVPPESGADAGLPSGDTEVDETMPDASNRRDASTPRDGAMQVDASPSESRSGSRRAQSTNMPVSRSFVGSDARVNEGCRVVRGSSPVPWYGMVLIGGIALGMGCQRRGEGR